MGDGDGEGEADGEGEGVGDAVGESVGGAVGLGVAVAGVDGDTAATVELDGAWVAPGAFEPIHSTDSASAAMTTAAAIEAISLACVFPQVTMSRPPN